MSTPSHVPNAVETFVKKRLDGDPHLLNEASIKNWPARFRRRARGINANLDEARKDLREIADRLENLENGSSSEIATDLRNQKVELDWIICQNEKLVILMNALMTDVRLSSVYSRLLSEFSDDRSKWEAFLHAAIEAADDYSQEREKIRLASILVKKIGQTARELSALLGDLDDVGLDLPEELTTIPGMMDEGSTVFRMLIENERQLLLRQNHISEGLETDVEVYFERMTQEDRPADRDDQSENVLSVLLHSSEYLRMQNELKPSLIDAISKIAQAAEVYVPESYGARAAAIASQKNNAKKEYIRAFWFVYVNDPMMRGRAEKNPNILHAMAGLAIVILGDAVDDVSYEDVRKALEDISKGIRENVPGKRKRNRRARP